MFLTGQTDTGKSTLARVLLLSAAAPRLVVDPTDSELFASIPGIATFRDPRRPPADAATARFVPVDPADRDAYDLVYRWAYEHFPRYVLLDEAGLAAPAQGSPRWLRALVVQGRKRQLGHAACHTRPVEVDRNLLDQARHMFVFDLPSADDRKYLATRMGVSPALLDAQLAALERRGFLWWDQGRRLLTPCRPLRVRAKPAPAA